MEWVDQVLETVCCYKEVEAVMILLALLGALGMQLKRGSKQPMWLLKRGLNGMRN